VAHPIALYLFSGLAILFYQLASGSSDTAASKAAVWTKSAALTAAASAWCERSKVLGCSPRGTAKPRTNDTSTLEPCSAPAVGTWQEGSIAPH
jgi:hypothetical protein